MEGTLKKSEIESDALNVIPQDEVNIAPIDYKAEYEKAQTTIKKLNTRVANLKKEIDEKDEAIINYINLEEGYKEQLNMANDDAAMLSEQLRIALMSKKEIYDTAVTLISSIDNAVNPAIKLLNAQMTGDEQ